MNWFLVYFWVSYGPKITKKHLILAFGGNGGVCDPLKFIEKICLVLSMYIISSHILKYHRFLIQQGCMSNCKPLAKTKLQLVNDECHF